MFSWPAPRRGSLFTSATSSAIGAAAVADRRGPGIRCAAATSLPSIDQQPVVVAQDHALDHDARAFVDGDLEGLGHLVVGGEVDRDAAAVVAVDRLHHHRVADGVARRRRRPRRRGRGTAAAPAGRGRRAAGCRAPCRRRSRRRCARSARSAPPRCASGTCPGRPGSGSRRSAAPRGCRAPRPRAPAPAPRARASGGRRSGRSRRSPRRCRRARPSRGAISSRMMRARHLAGLEADLLGLVAVEHLDLVGVRRRAGSSRPRPGRRRGSAARPRPAPSARRGGSRAPPAARRSGSPRLGARR